jgi:hypothetical protein
MQDNSSGSVVCGAVPEGVGEDKEESRKRNDKERPPQQPNANKGSNQPEQLQTTRNCTVTLSFLFALVLVGLLRRGNPPGCNSFEISPKTETLSSILAPMV